MAIDVLVALPELSSAWGRTTWGVGTWGGWDFAEPTPMDCDVQGIDIERGRSDALDHISAGGMRITLQDPERKWSPWVIPADGFRRWRTGVPIQARTPAGHLFTGVVTEIHASEKPEEDFQRIVEIVALDPLTFLAITDEAAQADQGTNELAGARLERIWDNALPPSWVEHVFDPGMARMQSTSLARPALEEMWLTADSDAGVVSCTTDGVVRFWDIERGLTEDRRVVPQVTFTDDDDAPASTPVVCTTKFDVTDDQAPVINWIGIAAAGGTQEVVTDDTSIAWYGRRSTHRNDLIHNEGQSWSRHIAETFLSRVDRQSVVITPLVFNALQDLDSWEAAHSLDVVDRVAVHRSAGGDRLDITASIDQIQHQITPYSWQTTIQLAPGTQRTAYTRWGTAQWGVDAWS